MVRWPIKWLAMDVRHDDGLVRQRGWPLEPFQRWRVDTVVAALLKASHRQGPERPRWTEHALGSDSRVRSPGRGGRAHPARAQASVLQSMTKR
jgi:hypothetical protein